MPALTIATVRYGGSGGNAGIRATRIEPRSTVAQLATPTLNVSSSNGSQKVMPRSTNSWRNPKETRHATGLKTADKFGSIRKRQRPLGQPPRVDPNQPSCQGQRVDWGLLAARM